MIKNGFRRGGVYPFSDSVITVDKYEPRAWTRFVASQQATRASDGNAIEINEGSCEVVPKVVTTRDVATATCNCIASSSGVSHHGIIQSDTVQVNSFESILLDHVKQIPVSKTPRKLVCSGAEVITSADAVMKLERNKSDKKAAVQRTKNKKPSKKQ